MTLALRLMNAFAGVEPGAALVFGLVGAFLFRFFLLLFFEVKDLGRGLGLDLGFALGLVPALATTIPSRSTSKDMSGDPSHFLSILPSSSCLRERSVFTIVLA